MLEALEPQPADKILELMARFREDGRAGKIDLGVGVYRDATGNTPVMRAVRAAERRIWEAETTKTYTALAGEPAFNRAMTDLVLGAGHGFSARMASAATPGGTGAIRQAFEVIRLASPKTRIWLPAPTWPNHTAMARFLGIAVAEYRYFDAAGGGIDLAGLTADLAGVAAGDAVLLHGCCHNPTGADLSPAQWGDVIALLQQRGAVPLVDLAYQGFGDGLEADAAATRRIAAAFPEVLIAASCSKNFGIYRERSGIIIAIGEARGRAVTQGTLAYLNRQTYSFPPDHGARLVTTILDDSTLRTDWQDELDSVRDGMLALRRSLAEELRRTTNSDRFDFVARHRGMFSRLGLTPEQVTRLREERAIYMGGDSRVNIAGLNPATVPVLAGAVAAVL